VVAREENVVPLHFSRSDFRLQIEKMASPANKIAKPVSGPEPQNREGFEVVRG
jgi:hypothetical protein